MRLRILVPALITSIFGGAAIILSIRSHGYLKQFIGTDPDAEVALQKRARWVNMPIGREGTLLVSALGEFGGQLALRSAFGYLIPMSVLTITSVPLSETQHTTPGKQNLVLPPRHYTEHSCTQHEGLDAITCQLRDSHIVANSFADSGNTTRFAGNIYFGSSKEGMGYVHRSDGSVNYSVAGKEGYLAHDILMDIAEQEATDCTGDCFLSRQQERDPLVRLDKSSKDMMNLDPYWACYTYKAVTAAPWVALKMGNIQRNFNYGMEGIYRDMNNFVGTAKSWKYCAGIDGWNQNTYDSTPNDAITRGEVYFDTCGGIDSQCAGPYSGEDDRTPFPSGA